MKCQKCEKGILIRQYRVYNSLKDCYCNSLEQAESRFEELSKLLPNGNWKLCELFICNDCDFVEETILKQEATKW